MRKKIATLLTLLLVSFGLTVVTTVAVAPVANAAGECGSGYSYIHGHAIRLPGGTTRTGTLEIYYNSGNGYNCVINRCYSSFCGIGMYRGVFVKRDSQSTPACNGTDIRCDVGWFRYYAGPVYVYARNSCIDAYGWLSTISKFGTGAGSYLDANSHCG